MAGFLGLTKLNNMQAASGSTYINHGGINPQPRLTEESSEKGSIFSSDGKSQKIEASYGAAQPTQAVTKLGVQKNQSGYQLQGWGIDRGVLDALDRELHPQYSGSEKAQKLDCVA